MCIHFLFLIGFIPISNETNIVQLSRTMEDILTAGIVSSVEVVPWLLTNLVHRLMDTVAQMSPLVPQDLYLPAPPLYCPQPSDTSEVRLILGHSPGHSLAGFMVECVNLLYTG